MENDAWARLHRRVFFSHSRQVSKSVQFLSIRPSGASLASIMTDFEVFAVLIERALEIFEIYISVTWFA